MPVWPPKEMVEAQKKAAAEDSEAPLPERAEPRRAPALPAALPEAPRRPRVPALPARLPEEIERIETAVGGPSPPLFIKVERYTEVLDYIQKLRSHALSLRDALNALNEIQKEIETGLGTSQKALDSFNSILGLLYEKLSQRRSPREKRPEPKPMPAKPRTPQEVETYAKNLFNELERLKSNLKSIS